MVNTIFAPQHAYPLNSSISQGHNRCSFCRNNSVNNFGFSFDGLTVETSESWIIQLEVNGSSD